jgi:hypothetical protein
LVLCVGFAAKITRRPLSAKFYHSVPPLYALF